ncbi:MAG: acyl carrier protein [Lewinellaceae bacterium]|nr:acyl carrier protein [Lewinellaceae bacterium]
MKMEELLDLIEVQLGKKRVRASDHFINDLQAESLDMVHLASAIEDRFGIMVPEKILAQAKTVQELFDFLTTQTTA